MNNPFPPHIRNIAVIAPAGRCMPEALTKACHHLEGFGINVRLMPNCLAHNSPPYLSANDHDRVHDLHTALSDPQTDLILCARGGYGSARILELIDWELMRSRQLPIVGYSDITALHLAMLGRHAGIPIAGPMCLKLYEHRDDSISVNSLKTALLIDDHSPMLPIPELSIDTVKNGFADAPAVAVNLTVAASLCGGNFMPDLAGHILIVEDIAEPAYKIDRCLNQLRQNGILARLAGLVFASFRDCGTPMELDGLFRNFADLINGPVVSGFPFGHQFPTLSIRQRQRMIINTGNAHDARILSPSASIPPDRTHAVRD